MSHKSSRESSRPPSPHKENLIIELEETKRNLKQKEENMRQLIEKRLKDSQGRQKQGRRWGPVFAG